MEEENDIPTLNSPKKTEKQPKKNSKMKEKLKELLSKKVGQKIKLLVLAHPLLTALIILIIFLVFLIIGIILFFILTPGLTLGNFDEFGQVLYQNLQGILTGDSTTAQISDKELIDLAEHLESMNFNIRGYGLGNVTYEDDGSTTKASNGSNKKIIEITESVDGKNYLKSYIAANENTYVLSQYSIGGAFRSMENNIKKGAIELVNLIPFVNISTDDLKATSAEDYSTGMINIIGQTDSSIFESKNASDFVSIDRESKQMKIYSDAFRLPDFGGLGLIKRLATGDSNIQWGETFSYDLNNWLGRYGRPTELFEAIHLSTLMPDLAYEIATNQDFNTKVNIGLLDASVQFTPTATKLEETIDSVDIMKMFLKECVGVSDVDSLKKEELETEFRNTTNNIIAYPNLRTDDEKISGSEFTRAEIAELAAITHVGKNKSVGSTSSSASMAFSAVGEDNGNFTKYDLSDAQLSQLTFIAYREQGTDAGAAAEASIMANLYELRRGGNGGANGLVDYVLYGGWFASGSSGSFDNDEHHKDIVRQVLVKGKRTLPAYIDEHDCFSDIPRATNNGNPINVSDRSAYVKDTTVIDNRYGSTYTFYSFPGEGSDPFGYHEKFGSDFHYEFDSTKATSSNVTATYNNSNTAGEVPFITGVNISRDEFISKCSAYYPPREFTQYAGTIYDVCVRNNINPIFCAAQAWVEQGWNSPNSARGNFWGLGIYNGMQTSIYGEMSIEPYTQKWCDNIQQRLRGEVGVLEQSKRSMQYSNKYTGGVNTVYDVLDNYAAPDNDNSDKGQADYMIDYIDNYLLKSAKDIFGEDKVDLVNVYSSGKGINIKWPYISSVTNHWYYNDIDFTKNVYRFAKSATKTMDYKPDDEENVLNKNNVTVKLDAEITSDMGVIYQVAEPEAVGPNSKIIELFNQEYYQYNGSSELAKKIEMKKAQDEHLTKFKFGGEEFNVDKQETEKIKKQKVSIKNRQEASIAFGILENMHTEASDYIYRDLKELLVSLKYYTRSDFTEDLKEMLLWPIETNNQNSRWELTKDENKYGTTIWCNELEENILVPSDAVVKEIDGNSITLQFTTLNKESAELLEYIYSTKDSFKKINRELLTGAQLKIENIHLNSKIKQGDKLKRGDKLGKAMAGKDNKRSVILTFIQIDQSIIGNIEDCFRQEDNNKYEEIMKLRKEAPTQYKEGIEIYDFVNTRQNDQNSYNTSLPDSADIKQIVDRALSKQGATWVESGYNVEKNQFTCSGLVDYAFGYESRAHSPESFCEEVRNKGNLINYDSSGLLSEFANRLKYGDLVFCEFKERYPGHVGIYIGEGKMIHSAGAEGVHIETLESVNTYCPIISGGTFLE